MDSNDQPRPLVLSLASVGADEERYLRSLLALLKSYLEPQWCLAARLGDFPDAVLVDMDGPEGRQVWENVHFGGIPRIALSRDQVLGAEWTLLKPIKTGGAHSVTEVLSAVAGKLQLSDPARDAPGRGKATFAALVRRACQQSHPADLVLANGSVLVIDPVGKLFYSSRTTDELIALLRSRRRLEGKVVPVASADKLPSRLARWGILPRPLEELLWLTGLVTGAGESLGGWNEREAVRLARWPDFAALPYRQAHLKMAAMLTTDGMLPEKLAQACEVAAGDVADFLNACAEIGILESRAAHAGAPAEDKRATTMDIWRGVVGTFKRGEPGQ
ncbi:MAG TPA: hypothetical protein VLV56_03665 [Burkholderiales bacterium]|nr:hypothetical protein [Burkholderiales bacterium]